MKQPDLYYFETIKMTSQAWSNLRTLTRLVTSFLWFQNSIVGMLQHCKSSQTESACIATFNRIKVIA